MTPKEKATQLVNDFSNECLLTTEGGKVAALIAVNEILLATGLETKGRFEFYLEVKKEIELL